MDCIRRVTLVDIIDGDDLELVDVASYDSMICLSDGVSSDQFVPCGGTKWSEASTIDVRQDDVVSDL